MQYQNNRWAGETALNELTQLLVRIVDLRDPSAEKHSEGVGELSAELAGRINMDVEERKVLQHAAILHDVGKVAITDSVIHKPARLTRAEYLMVQQHTVLGYNLLQPLKIDAVIPATILSHHENYDGSGYPEGLKGEAIPLAARLIRIADFYDALTSHRPYRDKVIYNSTEALDVLQENRHCFDPFLFDTFVEMITEKL
jgi:putative nucleotidyltransferase with HDIG domain